MLRSLFIFLFLSVTIAGIAQNDLEIDNARASQLKHLAQEAQRSGDLYLALTYYKKLIELTPSNIKTQYTLAELYRYTRNYKEAETYYEKVVKNGAGKFPNAMFYFATMQKANGKYKEALETFNKMKKASAGMSDDIKKLYKIEMEGCTFALSIKDTTPKQVIRSMGNEINNPHVDFSPVPLTSNSLIFGSLRQKDAKLYSIEPNKKDSSSIPPVRKLYVGEKQESGEWKYKGEWEGPFNSKDEDVANGTFSMDHNRFYFTRCAKNWQYKVICKIYYSEKKAGQWLAPVLLDEQINMPEFTATHPAMGTESKKKSEVLYFVSDRPGTKGGMDIWYAEYDSRKKAFKEPKNAGSKINSIGTEMTPFYDLKTKTLYFSSDGKAGLGGLDIYSSIGELNKWSVPVNLGPKLNSSADDLDFALNTKGNGGFIVSNRKGGQSLYNETCCDDIYEFTYTKFIEYIATGKILNKESHDCVENALLSIYVMNGDDKFLSEEVKVNGCNYKLSLRTGYNYVIEANKDGYLANGIEISTKNMIKSDSAEHNFAIEKMPDKPFVIPVLNYEFNSAKLTAESQTILDTTVMKLLTQNPTLIIELSSHTDNKGADDYNMKLSQKRAESIVTYLTSKGINSKRLIAKGYGETVPIAPNQNKDGSDNPEGRQLNRRTEIKILGQIDLSVEEDKATKKANEKEEEEPKEPKEKKNN